MADHLDTPSIMFTGGTAKDQQMFSVSETGFFPRSWHPEVLMTADLGVFGISE